MAKTDLMSMGRSKQVVYNTIGNSVTLFCQWLIMMLIPKITDFSDAGVFAVALSICSIFNIFATFSMNQYQIADQYRDYSESDYFLCRVYTIILSFVLCAITIVIFGYSVKQSLVIIAYMLYRNILHYVYLYAATLQIEERLDYVGKCMILEGLVSLASFITVYVVTYDLVLAVVAMALLGGGSFAVSVVYGYRKTLGRGYSLRFTNRSIWRSMFAIGIPLLLSGVAPIVITAIPKIMLQMSWGDEIVGIFSTLSAPTIVVPTLITGVFTPFIVYFSNLAKSVDIATIRRKYVKMIVLVLAFGVLCLAASLVLGGFCFELLYGSYIMPYVWYFNILIIGIVLYSIGICGTTVLITKDQGREAAIASLIALFISLAIFLLTIPKYGLDAASFGLLVSYGIFGLLISLYVVLKPLTDPMIDN